MGRTACTEPQCLYKGALYIYFYYAFMKAVYTVQACVHGADTLLYLYSQKTHAHVYKKAENNVTNSETPR
jgi:hypothetical protein